MHSPNLARLATTCAAPVDPCRSPNFAIRAGLALLTALSIPAIAEADYGFDSGFNSNYVIDAFATGDNDGAYRSGNKLVVLPDGDIVVAGGMRFPNDPLDTAFTNVGLSRYNLEGIRQTWAGSGGSHFWFNQQYVVYPNIANGGNGDVRIQYVADIAYADGKIYVLAERSYEFAPFDADVKVLVFNEDGTLRDEVVVLGSAAQEFGVAFDVRETGLAAEPVAVTVLARSELAAFTIAKYNEASSGFLAADLSFNGGSPLSITVPSCSSQPVCDVSPADIARPDRQFGLDEEPIYVLGTAFGNGTDRDMIVMRITASGVVDTSFGDAGRRIVAFDEPGSRIADWAQALRVSTSDAQSGSNDEIWMAGTVDRSCKPGIGIAKLTSSGANDISFAFNGRAVFGGSTETGTVCDLDAELQATDMALQGGEIAVSGKTTAPDQGGTLRTDGVLLRVGTVGAAQRDLVGLPLIQNGSRVGDSSIYGIASAGNSRYVVSGFASWAGVYNSLYISARLWPADRIFADNFESGTGLPR
ncbi:MAG: hypothetical protein IPP82_13000 [Xanthomonadales bacterium]|nr:hypothetical protein [Xanthomonadales bacterium]